MIDPGLNGKHALITGANNPHGIGAATAKAFARGTLNSGVRRQLTSFRGFAKLRAGLGIC